MSKPNRRPYVNPNLACLTSFTNQFGTLYTDPEALTSTTTRFPLSRTFVTLAIFNTLSWIVLNTLLDYLLKTIYPDPNPLILGLGIFFNLVLACLSQYQLLLWQMHSAPPAHHSNSNHHSSMHSVMIPMPTYADEKQT